MLTFFACALFMGCASPEVETEFSGRIQKDEFVLVSFRLWFNTEVAGTREIVSADSSMNVTDCLELREAVMARTHSDRIYYHCDEAANWQ